MLLAVSKRPWLLVVLAAPAGKLLLKVRCRLIEAQYTLTQRLLQGLDLTLEHRNHARHRNLW